MAEWIVDGRAVARRSGRWTSAASGPHYRSPSYTLKRARGGLRDLLRHPLPGPRAPGRPAAAGLERVRLAPRARRRVRREVGLGAGQLVRVQRCRRATSRCARAAGRGCTGRRRSAPSTAPRGRRRACSTSRRSPSSRSRARRGRAARAAVRQPRRARGRRDHLHADAQPPRRDRVRLHRHPARGGACSRSSPAPRSATTTPAGSAATCPPTAR